MIELEGVRDFPQPKATLEAKLADMQFLVGCVPDVGQVKRVSDDSADLTIKPSLGFIRGELGLQIQRTEPAPPYSRSLLLKTKGIGSSADVVASFAVEENADGSRVRWKASVQQLGGLLKAVPKALIQATAQKTIDDMLKGIEEKVSSS